MSTKRQLRTFTGRYPSGSQNPAHSHAWDQLLYGTGGVMMLQAQGQRFVVPPHRAAWIPTGAEHSFRTVGDVDLQTLYLPPRSLDDLPRDCCVLSVSPLLRELILHCVRLGTVDARSEPALLDLVRQQIRAMPRVGLHLAWPRDPRAQALARGLEENPSDAVSLAEACRAAGASRRTMERIYIRETGLTLGRWRAQLRLCQSVALLATDVPVAEVAERVGYSTPSAFIEMFRRNLGQTPRRYNGALNETVERSDATAMVPVPTLISATGRRLGPAT